MKTTPEDSAAFEGYLRKWQGRLGLQDWRIVMSPVLAKSCMAVTNSWDWKQRQVTCQLGADWKASPVTQHALEQTAVHELLHVLLFELIEAAKNPHTGEDDLASVEHRIINVLEGLLVPEAE